MHEQSRPQLLPSEELFRALVQNSSDMISLLDTEGSVVFQSPSIERLLGYRPEDRIGVNAFSDPIVHPDDRAAQRVFFEKVRSTPGAGTQFDIWLPCAAAIEMIPAAEPHDTGGRGTGETVLVLENDRARLLRHEEILAALGYEPVGFTSLIDAINACRTTPTRFDAALLCCHLHGGATLIKDANEIRAAAPRLPLILATTSAREIAAPAWAGAGICGIIRHPLVSAELAGALATCLLPK